MASGDSYSAASGTLPPDPPAAPECIRSTVNYPHVIAGRIGAPLTDMTCGAAQTKDYFSPQYQGVPPQLDAVQSSTQLVTMTIGGNDGGVFINSIADCGRAGLSTLEKGSPCKDRYGTSFQDTITSTTYPALVNALRAVRARAPHASIAILGYPWILPAHRSSQFSGRGADGEADDGGPAPRLRFGGALSAARQIPRPSRAHR